MLILNGTKEINNFPAIITMDKSIVRLKPGLRTYLRQVRNDKIKIIKASISGNVIASP